MQLHYTGKHLEVTPALKAHADEKFAHLNEKFHGMSNVYIVFIVEKNQQIAEATIHISGTELHATASSNDMYHSIDAMIDKLTVQLTKHKEKLTDHH